MTYIAYLDEFGHIGPYVARTDLRHKTNPVFGLAGIILPVHEVRSFGTWFYQKKSELLEFEIARSSEHPARWEKKGSALYTVRNVQQYYQVRAMTNRLLNNIRKRGGSVFFCGMEKVRDVASHNPDRYYNRVLRESIKRINMHCAEKSTQFLLVLDQHSKRDSLITTASSSMYNRNAPRQCLVEPPFQVESHRYQTIQAADWISGLVGRLGAFWVDPQGFPENHIFSSYFEDRLIEASVRSNILRLEQQQ